MTKTGFEILKIYTKLSAERKSINKRVYEIYSKRLKMKFIRFIRQSNKQFRKIELTVYNHMHTRYQKNILQALKDYAGKKHQ